MSESGDAIHRLHARGWTDEAIGRAVERDSSLIHQVSVGKKPAHNLTAKLNAIAESDVRGPKVAKQAPYALRNVSLPPAPRRLTKAGQPARYRGIPRPEPFPKGTHIGRLRQLPQGTHAGNVRFLPNGQRFIEARTLYDARTAIGEAASMGSNNMKIAFLGTDGKWHTVGSHGLNSQWVEEMLSNKKSLADGLNAILDALHYTTARAAGVAQFYVIGAYVDMRAGH